MVSGTDAVAQRGSAGAQRREPWFAQEAGRARRSGPSRRRGSRSCHTVGVEGTGPITGARCRSPWTSLIDSPPRIWVSAMSIRTWA